MSGRKPLYSPETLKIGQKIELKGKRKKFGHQTAYNWNKRLDKKKLFRCIADANKVFIERFK